jgi:DNA-binding transcriptional regulator LsrR (DeoR family)
MNSVHLDLENKVVRQAVQENLVSFPSQVPVFGKQSRPGLQRKIVLLYFVCGWTMDDIAKRYGLGRQRMGQMITAWRIRALKEGYIQAIEPAHPLFQRAQLQQAQLQQACESFEISVRESPVVAQAMTA